MGAFFEFDHVESFTVGAIGQPGQRVFLLQARAEGRRVTVKCEKQQAAAIAQYVRRVLSDLPPPQDKPLAAAMELAADDAVFVLGPIALGYDRSNERLLVQLEEFVPADDDGELDPEAVADRGHVRVYLSRGQAAAFCDHCDNIVAAGRPNCIWCGDPIDPDGHPCVRMN